ncbi:MAG: NAD-dependent epimerase/dehydratase family protein, partial [Anaerolineae bacterium]|nr:NAD-dependent epimerase/dehydratase family protein [Anaerolineae bacterium]
MSEANRNERQVIFGTGPLGQSVMRALLDKGYTDICMVNRSGSRGEIPASVQVIASDAYDAAKVREVTQGAAVVYQCAQPGYTEWPEKFPPLQTAILEGTAASGAKLIVGENLYIYGDTNGKRLHEGLPYAPHGHKGRTRAAMAQQLLDAHKAGKVRVAMARGSDFYGEAVLGSAIGDRVVKPLLQGKTAQVFGDVDLPHTYTYIGDFGKAMVILGECDEALGRAWHVPNDQPEMTTRQLIEKIAAEIGVEPKVSAMPKLMFQVVALFHPYVK